MGQLSDEPKQQIQTCRDPCWLHLKRCLYNQENHIYQQTRCLLSQKCQWTRLAEARWEITAKLMSEIAVELNVIRVYLRRGLNVYIILMFRFMCYCIKNVCFYNNLSIAKWSWVFQQSDDVIYFEKMYTFVYYIPLLVIALLHTGISREWLDFKR